MQKPVLALVVLSLASFVLSAPDSSQLEDDNSEVVSDVIEYSKIDIRTNTIDTVETAIKVEGGSGEAPKSVENRFGADDGIRPGPSNSEAPTSDLTPPKEDQPSTGSNPFGQIHQIIKDMLQGFQSIFSNVIQLLFSSLNHSSSNSTAM